MSRAALKRAGKRKLVFAITGAAGATGGVAAVNLNLLHALVRLAAEEDLELVVLSLRESAGDRPDFLPGPVAYVAFEGNKRAFSRRLLELAPARPLYFFDYVRLALPLLPLAAAGLARTVIFAHGWEYWRSVRRGDRWSLRAAALVLTNSRFTLGKMREALGRFNGRACPLGLSPRIALAGSPPATPPPAVELRACDGRTRRLGERALLLVGRMHADERAKGHYALLEVLPRLAAERADVQLVFAGPGDDGANLERRARERGVAHAVFVAGYVPDSHLERLYRASYAFVMPSRQEGFGLAYLEAMNFAKACVGCHDQGAEDVIVDGETGFLVRDPGDAAELSRILLELVRDPCRARSMGASGFERLRAEFTAEHFRARVSEELARLL